MSSVGLQAVAGQGTLRAYLDAGGDFERHEGRHELVFNVFIMFGGKPWTKGVAEKLNPPPDGPGLDALVRRWTAEALADKELLRRLWRAIPARARREVEDTRKGYRAREAAFKAGEAAIEAFGHYQRRRNFSEKTIHVRRCVLSSFNWYWGSGVTLFTATRSDVERWLDGYNPSRDQLAPTGRYTYISHLHAFYRFAVRDGLTTEDPTLTIDRPRLPKRLPRPMQAADLAKAMQAADPRERAFLCLGAYQGFRISDMAGLCREDVLDHQEPPTILVNQGKGKKDRLLPAHPKTLEALRAYGLPESGPIFPGAVEGTMTVGQVGFIISKLFRRLGIVATPHALRHTFGTTVYKRSRDLLLTQRLMGHAGLQTVLGYVELNPDGREVDVVCGLGDED